MHERSYWLGFSYFPGIGPKKFEMLHNEFKTAKNAWEATTASLERVIGKALVAKFDDFRNHHSPSEFEKDVINKKVDYMILTDKEYPSMLKEITDPPFVLYRRGKLDFNLPKNQKTIAIVGTRKITDYGRQVTEDIAHELTAAGFIIVSGLAMGVDAAAHNTAVENNGLTVAVLGCGVDCCYPSSNQRLYKRIISSGGAIVSEFPPGMKPSLGSFPSRNRIIAGLSKAVIVTEGASDSGALYTAGDAFAIGRPVFAVPGPITSSLSKGPHSLIAKGGKLISGAEDIIQELGLEKNIKGIKSTKSIKGDSKEEQKIIELLQNEELHFDELVKRTKVNSSKLGGILSLMEMKGMIRSHEAGFFGLSS